MEHIKINWQKQILRSELPAPAKHLMLTLSIYMDLDGSKCFPSIGELEYASGLTRNTIKKYIRLAIKKKILTSENAGYRGAKSQQKKYYPTLNGTGGQPLTPTTERGATSDPLKGERGSTGDQRGSTGDTNHTITIKDKRPYSYDSIETKLSQKLYSLILQRNPEHKKPNFQWWSKDIDRLIRLDGKTPEKIAAVIEWSQADNFWQNNILSPAKLRKQFDQLTLKMNGDKSKTKPCRPTGVVL